MPRILSLFLPQLSINVLQRRLRRRSEGSSADSVPRASGPVLAIVGRQGNRQVVLACCERAMAQGVQPAMPLAQARALLSGQAQRLENHEPALDRQRLDALAQWAMQFSPLVQVDPYCPPTQGGLLLDIAGCQRLFGGEPKLLERVCQATGRLGLQTRLASANTLSCAWAVAHYGRQSVEVIADGREADVLASLPSSALRLDDATVAALAEVGLRRIGQILAMPSSALRQRFGPTLLTRLDQALGKRWEAVEPIAPRSVPQEALELAGPVSNPEAIQLGVRNLLGKLLAQLGPRQLGLRRLQLTVKRSDAPPLELALSLACASCEEKHLWTLLRPQIEQLNMGFGVEALYLRAVDTALLEQTQIALLPQVVAQRQERRMDRSLGELVDVLTSRVGREGVVVLEPVASHVPERAFACRPAVEALRQPTRHNKKTGAAAAVSAGVQAAVTPDRPSVLLDRPEPVTVTALSPDGPVVTFRWKGQSHAVNSCFGPERIAPQWWNMQAVDQGGGANDPLSTRDYFKLQDDTGRWLWLYRQLRDNRWYVHGIWD